MDIKKIEYCANCGEVIENENYFTLDDGRLVCDSCFNGDTVGRCEHCGRVFLIDDMEGLTGVGYVCKNCVDEYTMCDHCGAYFLDTNMYTDGNINLCYDCRYDNYYECHECGDFVLNEDAVHRNGNAYCEDCAPEDIEDYIRSYHDNPYYEEKRFPEDNVKELFGFELEMGGIDYEDDLLTAAKTVLSAANGDAWLCSDSSISDYGFELITHPMSLNYILNGLNLEGILREAIDSGLLSHSTGTCGLHVHVNRGYLGKTTIDQDLTTAKLLILFSYFWDKIVHFSRRTASQLDEWACYDSISFDPQEDTIGTLCEKACEKRSYAERYRAINLCNRHTIEFRIFRGSLKLNTVLATLQFVYTVVNFAKKINVSDIQNVTWEQFIKSDFAELNGYLAERGLI